MPEIRDFLESQKERIHSVRGEPPRTHCFQKWDQGGSRRGPNHYRNPLRSQQEIHEILLGKDKLPPEVHLGLCADS